MKIWEIIIFSIIMWGIFALVFWPVWDFALVVLKKIPRVEDTREQDLMRIYNKGFLFHYSAFKRFKKIKMPKKTPISVAVNEFRNYVNSVSPNKRFKGDA